MAFKFYEMDPRSQTKFSISDFGIHLTGKAPKHLPSSVMDFQSI